MEEWTVVSFFVEKGVCGRGRRREGWRYHVENCTVKCSAGAIRILEVYLPEFGRKKKLWRAEEKTAYLQGIDVPDEGRNVCYLYGEGADTFLGRQREILSFEWSLFLLRYFAAGFSFGALLLLQDEGVFPEDWVRHFARTTRYVGVLTKKPSEYEELVEEIFSEYGFAPDVADSLHELYLQGARFLVVATHRCYDVTPAALPHGCVWLSVATDGSDGKKICSRIPEGQYLDIYRFLKEMQDFQGKCNTSV